KCLLLKAREAYHAFNQMIKLYCFEELSSFFISNNFSSYLKFKNKLPEVSGLKEWSNVGGQLIRTSELEKLIKDITTGKVKSWDDIHQFYKLQGESYENDKFTHAVSVLKTVLNTDLKKLPAEGFSSLLKEGIKIQSQLVENIYLSRAKDYTNPFRAAVYENMEEMEIVTGALEENSFINSEKKNLERKKRNIKKILSIIN